MKKNLVIIALISLVAFSLIPVAWTSFAQSEFFKDTQIVETTIYTTDKQGSPLPAHILVYELSPEGPKMLTEGSSSPHGAFKHVLSIPRKLVVSLSRGGVMEEVYQPVNVWVIAYTDDGRIGSITLPLDPTVMTHPVSYLILHVTLSEPSNGEAQPLQASCVPPQYPYQEVKWLFTKVLEYGLWDNISAQEEWIAGSKIRVQTKERYWLTSTCSYTGWSSSGYTDVTLDRGITTGWVGGEKIYVEKFEIQYYFVRLPVAQVGLVEKIYAADTSTDPRALSPSSLSWSGSLPVTSYYYITPQNTLTSIPITGSSDYSIGAGVCGCFGEGASICVCLDIGKEPSPSSYLNLQCGAWYKGYAVKTVSSDASFLVSYSNWVPRG